MTDQLYTTPTPTPTPSHDDDQPDTLPTLVASERVRLKLRALPSVDALLAEPAINELIIDYGHEATVDALRTAMEATRTRLRSAVDAPIDPHALIESAADVLEARFMPTLRPVINATGVIIHANLGRALLSEAAQGAVLSVAGAYNTLEYDLENGKRGNRRVHAAEMLREITGAEDALVVNNNTAALVLMLAGLAHGREVIVSRGQVVEIGGGFRVPDIMAQSGARLVEVGTTNRTRLADYERALTENTALLMRVHASNFKQVGFTESAEIGAMAHLAHERGLYCVDDLGGGALIDTATYGLDHEPTVLESIAAGVDLVCFSGDKLLGGPQAGILVGRKAIIDQLKRHPLARALRADKLCLAALCATLDHYRRGEATRKIPVWQMISRPLDDLRATAERWRESLRAHAPDLAVIDGKSTVGGSLPGATLPTALLAVRVSAPDEFTARLRQLKTPIIARITDGRVLFDPRTVLAGQEPDVLNGLKSVL